MSESTSSVEWGSMGPSIRKNDGTAELGLTGLSHFSGIIAEEWLQNLTYERGMRAYREMSENDPIVGALIFAIEMLCRGVTWTVEPGGESSADRKLAELMSGVLTRMDEPFSNVVSEWAGAAPAYGFAPFEIVLRQRDSDGFYEVRKLAIRHPTSIERWEYDDDNQLRALIQRAPPDFKERRLPIQKMLLFRIRHRKDNPMGMSLLRNAYTSYVRKKRIEDIEAVGMERDLAGIPVFYVPPQWLSPDATEPDKASLVETKRIGKSIKNNEQACVILPAVFDENGHQLVDLRLLTSGGRKQFDTSPVVERYNRAILLSVLHDVLLIGHEKVGSYALAGSKDKSLAAALDAMLDGIADELNTKIVPMLCRVNGFTVANPPKFTHGDVQNVNLDELGQYVSRLAQANLLKPSANGEVERYLARAANLPTDGNEGAGTE